LIPWRKQIPAGIEAKPVSSASIVGDVFASKTPMPFEIVFGRWLAVCAHPICAWRRCRTSARVLVVTSYFAAGYFGVLAALLAF